MNTDSDTPPSPAPDTRKGPGRPRSETPQQRIERIRQELQQAETALKVSEEKRAGIVGAAALRHARHNGLN